MTATTATGMEIYKFKWRYHLKRNVLESEGPAEVSTSPQQTCAETQAKNSTAVPRKLSIKIGASKRILIPERNYFAKCIRIDDPFPNRRYRKFQLKVHFQIHGQHVAQAGMIVTKFVDCGRECDEPEIGPDTWLGRMMKDVTTDPQDVLLGFWFRIKVETAKAGYSRITEVELVTPARASKLECWQPDGIPF